jgi:glycosyltransferase involved in cell wall biosynthesis
VTLRAAHQAMPALSPGDGIGNYALRLRAVLRGLGLRSEIFAGSIHPTLRDQAHPIAHLAARIDPGDALLYHYAVTSPELDAVLATPARRVLVYQNPTPPEWFDLVSARNQARAQGARERLPEIAPEFELAVTLSEYSLQALDGLGFARRAVWPPAVEAPPKWERQRHPEPALVLGVGRIVPNKRWEVLIRAMAALRRSHPLARCELLGNPEEMQPYAEALTRLANRLDSGTVLRGKVPDKELARAYAACTLMAFPSAHEGFGVPLAEAMVRGIPIVASRHAAVAEVAGGAALPGPDDPLELAELLALVLDDDARRDALAARSLRRAAAFSPAVLAAAVRETLQPWGLPA